LRRLKATQVSKFQRFQGKGKNRRSRDKFPGDGGLLIPTLAAQNAAKVGHPRFPEIGGEMKINNKINYPTQRKER
jgi:hypothetical protein